VILFQTKYLLRIHIFLDMMQCNWVSDLWCFKGTWCTKFIWNIGNHTVQQQSVICQKTWILNYTTMRTSILTWLPSVLSPHTQLPFETKKTWDIFYALISRAIMFCCVFVFPSQTLHRCSHWVSIGSVSNCDCKQSSHAVVLLCYMTSEMWSTRDSIETLTEWAQCFPVCSIKFIAQQAGQASVGIMTFTARRLENKLCM
jgi:hypothetical protein